MSRRQFIDACNLAALWEMVTLCETFGTDGQWL